jgi:hypothetical protein
MAKATGMSQTAISRIWRAFGLVEADTFRIKIWVDEADGSETVIYDNGTGQALDGGCIIVHTGNH